MIDDRLATSLCGSSNFRSILLHNHTNPLVTGHWSPVTSFVSSVDDPPDLALAETRRSEATLADLGRDAGEDVGVFHLLALQLAVAASDELLERLGEVPRTSVTTRAASGPVSRVVRSRCSKSSGNPATSMGPKNHQNHPHSIYLPESGRNQQVRGARSVVWAARRSGSGSKPALRSKDLATDFAAANRSRSVESL